MPIANGQDPASECPGGTSCNGANSCALLALGVACGANNECGSGNCVDGFCCNEACNGTCKACSAALTGAGNGTCADLVPDTDPANECAGTQVCGMLGTCVDALDGHPCAVNGSDTGCASNQCVDGVCCASPNCNGDCKSCNQANTVGAVPGVCDFIKNNTDPDNECSGANTVCDGAGVCKP